MNLELYRNDAIEDPIARLRSVKLLITEYHVDPDFIAMPADEQHILRVAMHEAGHALTYLLHRRRFAYVSVRPDHRDESAGRLFGPKITAIEMPAAVSGIAAGLFIDGQADLAWDNFASD